MPTSYTDIFGGGTVQPSQVSYQQYVLTEDITLVWPTSFVDSPFVTARYMEFEAAQDGFTVTFPSAEIVSVGYDLILNNMGTHDITLNNNQGALIVNLAAGSLIYLVLVDNTTAAGVWRVAPFAGGASAVTQVAAVSTNPALIITGSPITASGTFTFALSLLNLWNAQTVNTLTGAAILQNSLAGSTLVTNSTPLTAMRSTGHSGFVVGNDADYTYTDLLYPGNASQLWYLPTQATQGAIPSLQSLLTIWNAQTANTFTGAQLLDGSIPLSKLPNSRQVAPFAMGYIQANGTIYNSLNVSSVTNPSPGSYLVTFINPASSVRYVIIPGIYYNNTHNLFISVGPGVSITQFYISIYNSATSSVGINNDFYFIVYDF